jgi:hypothetical protein
MDESVSRDDTWLGFRQGGEMRMRCGGHSHSGSAVAGQCQLRNWRTCNNYLIFTLKAMITVTSLRQISLNQARVPVTRHVKSYP